MKALVPWVALVALVEVIAGVPFGVALAHGKTPQFALDANGDYVDPKGIWRLAYQSHGVPINMSYEEMTPAQRALVRAPYKGMPENDEPPFPKDGLEPLLRLLMYAERAVRARGQLILVADVGADGVASSVAIVKTPNASLARVVGEGILLTRFKPAQCSGRPCAMKFFFAQTLSVER